MQNTRGGVRVPRPSQAEHEMGLESLRPSHAEHGVWPPCLSPADSSEQQGEEKHQSSTSPTSSKEPSSAKKSEVPKTPVTPKMTRFPPLPVTSDSVRTKCREMLIAALQTDGAERHTERHPSTIYLQSITPLTPSLQHLQIQC
ncbi:hypothetical protein FKM82_020855 [Ascaphus truei]